MTQATTGTRRGLSTWRMIGWGLAAAALLAPAIAMQFTSEVNWTASDFVVAAAMLLGAGAAIEISVRSFRRGSPRILAVIAIVGALLWLWAELAVGVFTNWGS